jgi:DNA-damage-inducible protein J
MTDAVIRSRIDAGVKDEAARLFKKMGLSLSDAIRLFVYQSVAEKRIPFSINIPNAKTQKVLEEARQGVNLETTSLDQLKADWKNACAK